MVKDVPVSQNCPAEYSALKSKVGLSINRYSLGGLVLKIIIFGLKSFPQVLAVGLGA